MCGDASHDGFGVAPASDNTPLKAIPALSCGVSDISDVDVDVWFLCLSSAWGGGAAVSCPAAPVSGRCGPAAEDDHRHANPRPWCCRLFVECQSINKETRPRVLGPAFTVSLCTANETSDAFALMTIHFKARPGGTAAHNYCSWPEQTEVFLNPSEEFGEFLGH